MPAREDFDRVGDLLGDVCETAASPGTQERSDSGAAPAASAGATTARRDLARTMAEAWPEVVGAEVAENASPVRLRQGSLVVSTSSSVWADALRYMSTDLMAKLNDRLGTDAVREIVFRHAGWEERTYSGSVQVREGDRERRRLTQEEEQAVAQVEEYDLPASLRERAARAMRLALERGRRHPVR